MTGAVQAGVVLAAVEFEVCWSHLGLGELPPVLDAPSPGRTRAERNELVWRVLDDLRHRGLLRGRDLHPDLVAGLTALARFSWAVDARVLGARRLRARAAATGRHGVLAVWEGDVVALRPLPPDALVAEVVRLAGDAPTGRGGSANVRAASLDAAVAAGGDLDGLAAALEARGERPADARAVARMCRDAHTRGQFGVRVTGRDGRPRSAPRVVAFHDTPAGRHLQLRRGGWVTVLPATAAQLAVQVGQVVDEALAVR
ncbi:ESX secretion-associated protein EspG [Saccharothrix syringae]|uniref:ESX secretion-associated protein EspG n=1 Tax=Saccharothrix syringae TaxID=103733 RepID=UPI0005264943|nr:ESX secretion-associated protein EspG [Saccharothrix syringae]